MDRIDSVSDVLTRGNLSRHYEPADFRVILDAPDAGPVEQSLVRRALKRLDSGRFRDMLDAAHTAMAYSDLEGQRHFAETHPDLLAWVSVLGKAEDLRSFDEYLVDDEAEAAADGGEPEIRPNYGVLAGK